MKIIARDIVYFCMTMVPFIYVVFWMNANPWWIALGTFLFMYTQKQTSNETQGCSRKNCCKQDQE